MKQFNYVAKPKAVVPKWTLIRKNTITNLGSYRCENCSNIYKLPINLVETKNPIGCHACAIERANERLWLIENIDTEEQYQILNLKKWCETTGVSYSAMYITSPHSKAKNKRPFVLDSLGYRWRVLRKL